MKRKMLIIFLSIAAAVCLCVGLTACGGDEAHVHTAAEAVKENEIAATCTTNGSYESVVYCSDCGEEISRVTVTVERTGHSWDDGVVTREPTCDVNGLKTYTCEYCGNTKTEPITCNGHTLTSEVTKEATCTERGEVTYTCSVCGHTHVTYTDKIAHTLEHVDAKEATADETGNIEYWYCTECGKCFTDSEGATEINSYYVTTTVDHTLVHYDAVDPTCTTAGNIEYWYCLDCGKYFTDSSARKETTLADVSIAATGHNSIVHVDALAATCTVDGNVEYWTCTDCGSLFSDSEGTDQTTLSLITIAAGHTLTHVESKNATASENGNVEYWYCSACDTYFSDSTATTETTLADVTILAGHDHDIVTVSAVAATCTETGNIAYYQCSTCGICFSDAAGTTIISYDSTVISATGHYRLSAAASDATCTTDGNVEYWYCKTCGKIFSDRNYTETTLEAVTIKATGHTLEHTDAVAATCTADGNIEYWYCTTCKTYFSDSAATTTIEASDTIIAGGHVLTHVESKNATDSENGNVEYWSCSVCGLLFSDSAATTETTLADVTIAAGHTHTTIVTVSAVAATCTEAGNIEYYICSECGICFSDAAGTTIISYDSTITAATGHSYSYKNDDNHDNGHWQVCSACGDITASENHTYNSSNVCTLCGYKLENSLYYTLSVDGSSYVVSGFGSWTSTEVKISESFYGLPVTAIGEMAFMNNSTITKVTIPASVITIGAYSFYSCTALQTITFGEDTNSSYGFITIGKQAFNYCTSLSSIDFVNRVESIGYQAFYGCTALEKVENCENLITIGRAAFNRCSSLKYFNSSDEECIIPESVTTIEAYAFYLTGLTNVTIGSGVNSIGVYAFSGCSSLTNVTFSANSGWYVTTTVTTGTGTEEVTEEITESVTLIYPATNAIYLTSTYVTYDWYRVTTD